jgi:glucokinase
MNKLMIAGDIGGTKTILQLLKTDGVQYECLHSQRYVSAEHADFKELLAEFIHASLLVIRDRPITSLCLGIAGPINMRSAQVTNLPWVIDADELQRELAIGHIELINDFAAVGYGIDMLQESDLYCLQTGNVIEKATRVVIGAGTGLGEGYLVWQGEQYIPQPSEGGHVDYAPINKIQIELLQYLQLRFGRVSYERVVSGTGLVNIYEFLTSTMQPTAALHHALLCGDDLAAIIADFAMQQKDEIATKALDIFIESYGAQAGNLALTCLARGGVYIAGGIAPKLVQRIVHGDFMRAFREKGRFASFMESLPVKVVMNSEVGLHGASRVAMQYV